MTSESHVYGPAEEETQECDMGCSTICGFTPYIVSTDDLVVAQFTDEKWYRGRVLDVKDGTTPLEPQTAHVFFVDYGNNTWLTFDR